MNILLSHPSSARTKQDIPAHPWRTKDGAPGLLWFVIALSASAALAQGDLETLPQFPLTNGPLAIHQAVLPDHPFTVTGETGAILGLQDGSVEVWSLPTKVFSNLRLSAMLDDYSVPINLNTLAATIDVQPDHTTITYSHAAITVRQHMFIPAGEDNPAKGPILFFEIESVRPATLTISLDPAMYQMWPAPAFGRPSAKWVAMGTGGGYVLSTDNPENFGMVAMPNATPGIMAPYQERPQALPLQFLVRFDPKRDAGRFFPLLVEVSQPGERNSRAAVAQMQQRLMAQARALPEAYRKTQDYYDHFFDHQLTAHTPDARFDAALRWAVLAIDKSRVRTDDEVGLAGAWYPSFDSNRPGFGWFFGRDTLWTLYAVNSYGDRKLARQALEFIARRQRNDGKIMHEYAQTAATLTGSMEWSQLDYMYASADATPLFVLAMEDYVRTTGDVDFLRSHWEQVKKAYAFTRAHETNGVYDNSQGTGWVEAWPPKMPHLELYLAALDRASNAAVAELAQMLGDDALARSATAQAAHIADAIAKYRQSNGLYAFSRNSDGSYDSTQTIFPSVAVWGAGWTLPEPGPMLTLWASHHFDTDWGARSVSDTESVFDPISYHQGSVWPLFTGWASMAQYRAGRPLAGYAALMRNMDLTWEQDPGSVTEVISGMFYQPLPRSCSHQLWSSAMVVSPAIRGLFGVQADAIHRTLLVEPHLPATWDSAELNNVRIGGDLFSIAMKREQGSLQITVQSGKETVLCLTADTAAAINECHAQPARVHSLALPLPPVEVSMDDPGLPQAGATTSQPRVIEETYVADHLELTLEGIAGTATELSLRNNGNVAPRVEGAERTGEGLRVKFAAAATSGFVAQKVRVSW